MNLFNGKGMNDHQSLNKNYQICYHLFTFFVNIITELYKIHSGKNWLSYPLIITNSGPKTLIVAVITTFSKSTCIKT